MQSVRSVNFLLLQFGSESLHEVSEADSLSSYVRDLSPSVSHYFSFFLFRSPVPSQSSSSFSSSSSSLSSSSLSFCFVVWASISQLVSLWERNPSSMYPRSTFTYTSYLPCHWLPLCTPPHFLCVTGEISPKIYKGTPKLVPVFTWFVVEESPKMEIYCLC